ncbi:MAG: hypothetical protein AVDCRST_MAG73-1986, partial [uncultured Thermomicrobiales bacterium]
DEGLGGRGVHRRDERGDQYRRNAVRHGVARAARDQDV